MKLVTSEAVRFGTVTLDSITNTDLPPRAARLTETYPALVAPARVESHR
jgi:hypothetical protein